VIPRLRRLARGGVFVVALPALAAASWGCPNRYEADPSANLPPELRGDYAVFAQRCSKCHSLSRPLESGITDDGFWKAYVERMRRQPASGISVADEAPILRFLHYYSQEQSQKPDAGAEGSP
jgi:hypothetical protein